MSGPEGTAPLLKDLRILVIDSDGPSARLICAILEDEGCALRIASNGHEALEMVEELKPTLVVTELLLPDFDGLALVRALKGHPLTSNAPILAVTASNGPETRRSALEAGCTDYVRKPIDALSFTARLKSLLGRHVESSRSTCEGGPET